MSSETYGHQGGVEPRETLFPQVAEDLQTLSRAVNYHRWLYSEIQGALGRRIVEVGAGIGNFTPLLLRHGRVFAIEPDPAYVVHLRRRFAKSSGFEVIELALGDWTDETRARIQQFRPDTFVCLNVLEHIEADEVAIMEMYMCLQAGGHIVVVLPAMSFLYSPLDRRYGHFRRYQKRDAVRLISGLSDATIVRCGYMNTPGVFGWWVNHVLLRRERLPQIQTWLFDRAIVPIATIVEQVMSMPFGLSLVLWVRRNS